MKEQDLKQKIAEFLERGEGFKNETLENLNLSVRTYNCLRRNGIRCLEDANGMDVEDLIRIHNLGKIGVDEFLAVAESFGYPVDNGKLTRKFNLEEQQINHDEEKILIKDMELTDNAKRKLISLGYQYISDIVDIHFKGSWVKNNKIFIEELEKGMMIYGYALNKTGFFTKIIQENEQVNIFLEQLKKEGLKALNLIDAVYFKKDSCSMGKINRTFEAYLNFITEEKLKKIDDLEQIEKDIDEIREAYKACIGEKREVYKAYIDEQRQLMEKEEQKASFMARMVAKNREVRKYHHNPNDNHERIHSHNPFDKEREL